MPGKGTALEGAAAGLSGASASQLPPRKRRPDRFAAWPNDFTGRRLLGEVVAAGCTEDAGASLWAHALRPRMATQVAMMAMALIMIFFFNSFPRW